MKPWFAAIDLAVEAAKRDLVEKANVAPENSSIYKKRLEVLDKVEELVTSTP